MIIWDTVNRTTHHPQPLLTPDNHIQCSLPYPPTSPEEKEINRENTFKNLMVSKVWPRAITANAALCHAVTTLNCVAMSLSRSNAPLIRSIKFGTAHLRTAIYMFIPLWAEAASLLSGAVHVLSHHFSYNCAAHSWKCAPDIAQLC